MSKSTGIKINPETQPEAPKPDTANDETTSGVFEAEYEETSQNVEEGISVRNVQVLPTYDGTPLVALIDEQQLKAIHKRFLESPKQRVSAETFRSILESVLGIVFEDYDFRILYLKIHSDRYGSGWIIWADVADHLALECKEKNTSTVQFNLDTPIDCLPKNFKTHHRLPVGRLIFCPALGPDRKIRYKRGCYASVTHDGLINFWNLDLELVRSVTSKTVFLKVANTWITDMISLPDFDILCVSSTEGDLRFYDTTACQFVLRVIVTSLESAVVALHYAWSSEVGGEGHLVTGNMAGGVRIYTLCGESRGPFAHMPGVDFRTFLSEQVLRGELKGMSVKDYKMVHSDWVRQVYYNKALSSVLSCALSGDSALVMHDVQGGVRTYHASQGVKCFSVQEDAHLIATGGPDCLVRLWSAFVSNKAVCVFRGHHASVIAVVIQGDTQRVISLSKDRCIKVWDITFQNCIQTYTQLPSTLGDTQPLTTFYNPLSHSLIVAGLHFSVLPCGMLVPEQLSDGLTHSREVTCVIYNPLFKVLISMGCRSMIMVWNPWKGVRRLVIKNAHTKLWFGQQVTVEITAATFDPTYHLLLTGARDGTIKMWNFNSGLCVRNMCIESAREVTKLIWLKGRILATGWNRHFEEWEDGVRLSPSKCWEQRHTSDVLTAASNAPQCLATGSYAGELVFWRMETGQAYRRHMVGNPTVLLTLEYIPRQQTHNRKSGHGHDKPHVVIADNPVAYADSSTDDKQDSSRQAGKGRQHRANEAPPSTTMRTLAVHCLHFLRTRITHPGVGTLLVSLENGLVQVWSHHSAGGFLTSFQCAHVVGDYVVSMTSDPNDNYLITGTTSGYLKVWLLANFIDAHEKRVSMPLLRLQFPFMWYDRIEGRAKRRVRAQRLPKLLSSHRGHLRAVNALVFISPANILVSGSNDNTVRVWSLGGRYIGTLGTPKPWAPFSCETGPGPDYPYRIPPDIKRVGSFTTIRVLNGGARSYEPRKKSKVMAIERARNEFSPELLQKCVHGKALRSPLLGHWFEMPQRNDLPPALPRIDTTGAHLPVFCHLPLSPEETIKRPKTPLGFKERRNKHRGDDTHSVTSSL